MFLTRRTPAAPRPRLQVSWQRLRDAVRIPLYGCDCYAYGLLAAGHCDLVVEADLKPYDYMALVPVIQVGATGVGRGVGRGGGAGRGGCQGVVEADLKPYDYMALVPVIQVGWWGLGGEGAGNGGLWGAAGSGGTWQQG
jgi:fructose-1,6-bisphosphatase/inositol monophosphatase family enzyme